MESQIFNIVVGAVILLAQVVVVFINKATNKVMNSNAIQSNNIIKGVLKDFINQAVEQVKSDKGKDKMEWVVQQVGDYLKMNGFKITDTQLEVLAQSVYDEMKGIKTLNDKEQIVEADKKIAELQENLKVEIKEQLSNDNDDNKTLTEKIADIKNNVK